MFLRCVLSKVNINCVLILLFGGRFRQVLSRSHELVNDLARLGSASSIQALSLRGLVMRYFVHRMMSRVFDSHRRLIPTYRSVVDR